MQWIFDPEPPSGAKSGDSPIDKLLAPQNETSISERGIYIREATQNSTDQIPRVDGKNGTVVFRLI